MNKNNKNRTFEKQMHVEGIGCEPHCLIVEQIQHAPPPASLM